MGTRALEGRRTKALVCRPSRAGRGFDPRYSILNPQSLFLSEACHDANMAAFVCYIPIRKRKIVEAAVREFGRLDVLVNNAATTAFIRHSDLEAVRTEDWMRILSVNLIGAFQCARAAKDALMASGDGEIVNVSSISGLAGVGSSIPYCASKAALNNVTVTLARVFAPKVRVNAVAPGFITTRW